MNKRQHSNRLQLCISTASAAPLAEKIKLPALSAKRSLPAGFFCVLSIFFKNKSGIFSAG
jgi:hypothetical protein